MTRILSGAVLLAVVGGAIAWMPSWIVLILACVIAAVAIVEFVSLVQSTAPPVSRGVTVIATLAVCVAAAWPYPALGPVIMAVVLVQAALAVAQAGVGADTVSRVSVSVFGPLYVGLPPGAIAGVHWTAGRAAALILIAVIAISDTAQYYTGRLAGRRPLAPALSPKKTVEGAVGGLVAGSLALIVLGHWGWPDTPLWLRASLGIALVLLGITGDLFESMLKRGIGVKDSSALIPGHGGVLDRIDSVLFAAPVYYVVLRFAMREL